MIRKVMITAGACAWLALLSSPATAATDKANNADTYRLLSLFGDVFERVRNEYVEPVSDEELIEAALNGMLTSLDPHSGYLNPKSFRDMQVQTKGEFGGLGIEVTMENGWVKVISPIDDTPAAKAGLQPNDFITHLNGEPVQGLSLNDAVDRMRGPVNTDLKVTVRRDGQAPFEVTLTRAVIKIQTVKYKLQDNVGYIRVSQFVESTDTNLRKAIDQLKKDGGANLQGFVLDLRNNPGGLLDQAVAVAGDFLDKGEIVSTRSRHPEDTQRFNAHGKDLTDGMPLVVLINDGSASASEIVAGALQDHRRAILLGTKSFGKGSVQTIMPLKDHGAMRLTTARYYTPSGRSIQAVGIEPDIKVLPSKVEALNQPNDHFGRSEASLPHALKNDTLPKTQAKPESDAKTEDGKAPAPAAPQPQPAADGKTPPAGAPSALMEALRMGDPATDYQLARAIDLLRGLSLYKGAAKAN
ncbi:S41 family peptidase [Telmatospirillum siberiense]|uniref:Peptidase S41 n=1 Tax=Telmatospirillum siberiense TaxID=382514 RepID=A0A2N3PY87_9PROT|nr:S41 family peptidase [Telmatospirillum siberiense]PKU25367.1 peptidase S41 [Telmatospirillum siberiense]